MCSACAEMLKSSSSGASAAAGTAGAGGAADGATGTGLAGRGRGGGGGPGVPSSMSTSTDSTPNFLRMSFQCPQLFGFHFIHFPPPKAVSGLVSGLALAEFAHRMDRLRQRGSSSWQVTAPFGTAPATLHKGAQSDIENLIQDHLWLLYFQDFQVHSTAEDNRKTELTTLCVDSLSAHLCRMKSSPRPALPRAELGWLGWLPEASSIWRKKVQRSWKNKKKI